MKDGRVARTAEAPVTVKRLVGNWYKREGFIQFMLGNQWNCYDLRTDGRITLLFCWVMLVVGVILPTVEVVFC